MRLIFYNLALFVALVLGSPWWLWRMATTRKYCQGISERLGKLRPELAEQSATARRDNRQIVWLHAVSVGEVLAVSRLVEELDRALPSCRLLISTTTLTGQELARKRFGADRVFYCPLDLPWAVARYLTALQPALLVLAETEFWPNLLSACFRRSIPLAVVNARISDRSFPRYRRLGWFWRPILSRLDRVLAQSELDAERLEAIGCRPERASVAGNLKFDVRAAAESSTTRRLKSPAHGLRFVVAGSTLEGEESALLEAWPRLLAADPNLCLILAPRHPERFAAVAGLLRSFSFRWTQRSAWPSDTANSPPQLAPGEIILLDSIGELASIYSLAAAAFIGGSLIPAGGHNPLEPAQFGVPIIMGPHYANFRAIVDDLISHRAIRITAKEELAATLLDLLNDSAEASAMGARGREVFEAQSGATARCVEALGLLLPNAKQGPFGGKPIDPQIEAQAKNLRFDGAGEEAILRFLREKGCGKIDCVKILRSVYNIGLKDAKVIVDSSEVWKDVLGFDGVVRHELWKELEEASRDPESGIKRTESGFSIEVSGEREDN